VLPIPGQDRITLCSVHGPRIGLPRRQL
jgi:hypothetical protein